MSKITVALEAAVATVLANTPAADVRGTARQRADADKAFAAILKLIAPRIRHFIRQYGLVAHWDDAEQCCAIGVHRAIQGYDPEKAQFTTFVNWQLRGELQSLRFRVMTDQRPSAKKVEATTVSLHSITSAGDGEDSTLESMIPDADALGLTEAGASEYLAASARTALVDAYLVHLRNVGVEQLKRRIRAKRLPARRVEPGTPHLRAANHGIDPAELATLEEEVAQHRLVLERRVFDDASLDELETATGVSKERVRQITKRAARTMAELAATDPRFAIIADYRKAPVARARRKVAEVAPTTLLADADAVHNRLARVAEVAPEDAGSQAAPVQDDAGPRSFSAKGEPREEVVIAKLETV